MELPMIFFPLDWYIVTSIVCTAVRREIEIFSAQEMDFGGTVGTYRERKPAFADGE